MTDITYKIVLLGSSSVGKSSIIVRHVNNTFQDGGIAPTIASSYFATSQRLKNGVVVRLQCFDTAGAERFKSLSPLYFRGADGCLVVYDISDAESVESAKSYVDDVRQHCGDGVKIIFCGNKSDLEQEHREVSEFDDDVQSFCKENGLIFFESSAKTGHNIAEMFEKLAEEIYAQQIATQPKQQQQNADVMKGVDLSKPTQPPQQGGGCC